MDKELLEEIKLAAQQTFSSIEYEGIEGESLLLYDVISKIEKLQQLDYKSMCEELAESINGIVNNYEPYKRCPYALRHKGKEVLKKYNSMKVVEVSNGKTN